MAGFHTPTSSWWKPSSHRKPRGKNERLGTDVKSVAANERRSAGGAAAAFPPPRMSERPWK